MWKMSVCTRSCCHLLFTTGKDIPMVTYCMISLCHGTRFANVFEAANYCDSHEGIYFEYTLAIAHVYFGLHFNVFLIASQNK